MKWLTNAYFYCWYHIESLWIKSWILRRPFTYMMRDFMLQHKVWSRIIILAQCTGLVFLNRWNCYVGAAAVALYFLVMGHLIWGTPMKLGEQEEPVYTHG